MQTEFRTARVRPTGAADFILKDALGTVVASLLEDGEIQLHAVRLSIRETDDLIAWLRSL